MLPKDGIKNINGMMNHPNQIEKLWIMKATKLAQNYETKNDEEESNDYYLT